MDKRTEGDTLADMMERLRRLVQHLREVEKYKRDNGYKLEAAITQKIIADIEDVFAGVDIA